MFRFVPRIAAVLLLILAGTLAPAQAGERPIQAEGQGFLYAPGDYGYLNGSGNCQHLGACSLFSGLDFDELYSSAKIVPIAFVLEAANGDYLFATVDSEFDPDTGIVAGTITFAGGTGRFADVSGSARLLIVPDTSWFDFSSGYPNPIDVTQFSWALEGTIDY